MTARARRRKWVARWHGNNAAAIALSRTPVLLTGRSKILRCKSSDYHAQTPRPTWQPTQGLVGPGLAYSGPNQTPTPQQDAAPVLHHRPLNLHPHHRYLPIGKEMNKRADDAGIGCRVHTLSHLERARRRPSRRSGEMHEAGKVLSLHDAAVEKYLQCEPGESCASRLVWIKPRKIANPH
jgi:hypothetical protein